ncbi:CRISPR-associated protein Cmr4 [Thermosyntropha lipolytica DSM 11003]|uniref:CRISPR-associated protein Cmr4 n=1 Tax=Thermosyntropha lipolytica DSM 11003 TaxID=1123382 RepID=A0A1M5RNW3_9FIRM|nr:RAMP superfamily CRISPR-associated protein [Thermosyntropha lipolytica]SHH27788.1 CRISPR-associated protein Cmr4 [Thermosyntropha lipolytica DSM 11003]
MVKRVGVLALAADPVHIGTGGYSIGRVDNTIVRDPITNIPKIPATSLAGTWRYYTCLEIHKYFKTDYRLHRTSRKEKPLSDILVEEAPEWVKGYEANRYAALKCAGQDESPGLNIADVEEKDTGHCGRCLVCRGFGFSKKDQSWQGMIFFSDLNILFFPVFTREGTRWISTPSLMQEAGLLGDAETEEEEAIKVCFTGEEVEETKEGAINLGWLYLPYRWEKMNYRGLKIGRWELRAEDIVLVEKEFFSSIVNSNLEVRTSVAIDPLTGAAREKALFTSEAVPRGTIFKGEIRIFDKAAFAGLLEEELPSEQQLKNALEDAGRFFHTLGIGGMTTRGFGRMHLVLTDIEED